jgi:hypothetical protein
VDFAKDLAELERGVLGTVGSRAAKRTLFDPQTCVLTTFILSNYSISVGKMQGSFIREVIILSFCSVWLGDAVVIRNPAFKLKSNEKFGLKSSNLSPVIFRKGYPPPPPSKFPLISNCLSGQTIAKLSLFLVVSSSWGWRKSASGQA